VSGSAPRALGDSVRPWRLSGSGARPLAGAPQFSFEKVAA
jgi:hypothetical protein